MEIEIEVEVEVEEGRGRIEYKVVVEQLKRWSSKHRPNYLTLLFVQVYKMFCDFFLFLFLRERRGRMSLQPSWVDNTDIF